MEAHWFYEAGPSRKKSLEWDLNDWRWDGNLFVATPLNNSLSSGSEETGFGMTGKGKRVPEKRRRIVVVEDEEQCDSGAGSLALNLRGSAYPVVEADLANWEGRNVDKKSNSQGAGSSCSPRCQVEGCGADLSKSKDYHRRHKVCEMHAKASSAVVNNIVQRFCQQCSRFHLIQEFDEGKRSCRRRLAGHNRRRRKTLHDATTNVNPLIDDRATSYLLISLLRILTNLHSDSSDQSKDQDLLSHLLKSLATLAGSFDANFFSELLQASQDSQKPGTSAGTSSPNGLISNGVPAQASTRELPSTPEVTCPTCIHDPPLRLVNHSACVAVATADIPSRKHLTETSLVSTAERVRLREFDLNNAYNDTENFMEVNENSPSPVYLGTGSPPSCLLQDSHQSSPPQTSANSDSASAQSRSSSNGDAQSRTDRIVFKLFGKEPHDLPLVLRSQILAWLSHSPTEIESYIRPGCVILTIYLHLAEFAWEELCSDLSSNLNRLLYNSADNFWRTGWVYVRIQHHIAFIYNGKVLLSTPRLLSNPYQFNIVSVSPVAAAISSRVNFTVKGLNLTHSTGRLLCAFEGKYLVEDATQALAERGGEHEGSECLSFSCSLPNAAGRGFIEVEDDSLSSCFFPFIVAEDDLCSEIRGLENVIDVAINEDECQERTNPMNPRSQALYFLNEMGWLLRRSQLRLTSKQVNSYTDDFSLTRYKWLVAFAMDQGWCAVVRCLLDLLFQGAIDVGGVSPNELALSEGLLHSAVRKNCRSMVEFLLRYKPDFARDSNSFVFRPDMPGPSSLTPLHVVASVSGAESILDALTDDPGQFGLKAWRNAQDTTGFTPEDYARSRGHESYLNLVKKKLDKQLDNGHIVLDMPSGQSAPSTTYNYKQADIPKYLKSPGFEMERDKLKPTQQPHCNLCSQQLVRRTPIARSLLYRPAMLSMVGIAAVCVCVGLLFKGPPEVSFVLPPFSWERLRYGSS